MGLRCLLGHDFGEPEVEREREERGSEVVVTVAEVKTCARCGERQIVSENKEVTALDPSESSGETWTDDSAPAPGDAVGDGADVDTDEFDEPIDPVEDDAIILTDEDDERAEPDRAPGAWPDEPDREEPEPEPSAWPDAGDGAADEDAVEPSEPTAWPEIEDDDEGWNAEPADGESTSVEFGGGLTPRSGPVTERTDVEFVESSPDDSDPSDAVSEASDSEGASAPKPRSEATGFTRAGSVSTAEPLSRPRAETEFACPECGHQAASLGSSLRAGDICPECRRGYITEREV